MVQQVIAEYDYAANEAGELSFKEGDIITVTAQHPSGWWTGTLNGSTGTFPSNFTKAYQAPPVPSKPQRIKAAPATSAGGANPMAELQAKLARRNVGEPTSNAPRASIIPPSDSGGPVRAPKVSRATTLAPVSNKPPAPSRNKVEVPSSNISDAKAAISAQGGLFGGNKPGFNLPTGGLKKPPVAAAPSTGLKKPAVAPRVTPRSTTPRSTNTTPRAAAPAPRVTPRAVPRPAPVEEEKPMMARALYDYNGTGTETELLFTKDTEIVIKQKDDSGWWEGSIGDKSGWFPAEFVEEFEPGPTIADRLAEVGSTEKRLATPKKATRTGRRPPTRGKRAGHAVKSMKTETNDPPVDPSRLERDDSPTSRGRSLTGSAQMPIISGGAPTRAETTALRAGLRKTVAPSTATPITKEKEQPVTDFRANLRSTAAPGSIKGIKKDKEPPAAPVSGERNTSPFGPRVTKPKPKSEPEPEPEPEVRNTFGNRLKSKGKETNFEVDKSNPFKNAASKPIPSPAATQEPETKGNIFGSKVGRPKPSSPLNRSTENASTSVSLPTQLGSYDQFSEFIKSTYESLKSKRVNGTASNRPQLNKANSEHFSFAMCTVNGAKYTIGDEISFSLQEAAYPFLYAIAREELGNAVDHLVSDTAYTPNAPMTLHKQKAQNPFCPAGAIALCSSIYETQDIIDRSHDISEKFSEFAGSGIGCDMANIFASKKYSYTGKALAYWMQNEVPLIGNIEDTIDLVFQVNATFTSCQQLAVMAATLANNGKCPTTGRQVVKSNVAEDTISMMNTCKISSLKLSGHGGESGAVFVVVPGVGGFAAYSPILNSKGLSTRGTSLCNSLSEKYSF